MLANWEPWDAAEVFELGLGRALFAGEPLRPNAVAAIFIAAALGDTARSVVAAEVMRGGVFVAAPFSLSTPSADPEGRCWCGMPSQGVSKR